MKVCTKQVVHDYPIAGGRVSISVLSVDTKSKTRTCAVELVAEGKMQPVESSMGGLIPNSAIIEENGPKRQMFSWSQPLKKCIGKTLKKISIYLTIIDTLSKEAEKDILRLLHQHVPHLKLKSYKNSFKDKAKDKLKRILIDYAAFEKLPQLNDLLKLDFGCSHAHADSGLSSELPMVPTSHPDSDLQACPIQHSASSELPFIE